jgi:hypothetical protein
MMVMGGVADPKLGGHNQFYFPLVFFYIFRPSRVFLEARHTRTVRYKLVDQRLGDRMDRN